MTTRTTAALLLGNERLDCELRRSARRRTLTVEVYPDLRVVVRAPARCPAMTIDEWLASRSRWIGRQIDRFRHLARERPAPPRYVSGESHLYMGEAHRLAVCTAPRAGVTRGGGELHVAVRPGARPNEARRVLEAWYRARALEVFGTILAGRFAAFDMRHEQPTLRVRVMKSRWGSLAAPCAAVGTARDRSGPGGGTVPGCPGVATGVRGAWRGPARMTLNLALIRAPRECIEYVVVHELCHLEYRGHGPRFYALLGRLLPDWRERRRRLNQLTLS